jgi:RNA recognition motif-containing protein
MAGPSTSVKMLENPKASMISSAMDGDKKKKKKKKKKDDKDKRPKRALRSAGGQIWEDLTLQDWDPNGFRLFCGDLGNDVTDEVLTRVFGRYPSFQKAKVVRDRRSNKTKGFGFVSFKDPNDFVRAIKELDGILLQPLSIIDHHDHQLKLFSLLLFVGRYVGSRPIKLRKSNWRNRNIEEARKKEKERNQLMTLIKK